VRSKKRRYHHDLGNVQMASWHVAAEEKDQGATDCIAKASSACRPTVDTALIAFAAAKSLRETLRRLD
jgi:hypothetical protein